MTPTARCQAVIELLEAMESNDLPADSLVSRYFRARRYAGGGDRRAIQALFYHILRHRAQIDWWLDRFDCEITVRARAFAALALQSPWDARQTAATFQDGKFGVGPLSAAEQAIFTELSAEALLDAAQPKTVKANVPAWMEAEFIPEISHNWDIEMKAAAGPATVDLRVNALKATRAEVLDELAAAGIEAEATPYAPWGVRLARRQPLAPLQGYKNGAFEPQGEASQLAVAMVDAKPGMSVLDLCAGGGGKALALVAAMANQGRVVLFDPDRRKLESARKRLARSGSSIHIISKKSTGYINPPSGEDDCFDIVLLDVPCSGSGVWRRNPEAKWRLTPERLRELRELQWELISAGANHVREGGCLVYMTCSVFAAENQAQVDRFLALNGGDFDIVSISEKWASVTGRADLRDGEFLQLTPGRHGTDGFYMAVLKRKNH